MDLPPRDNVTTGARILAVEDTPHNLELMGYLLKAGGHEVLTATTGMQALAIVHEDRPDLIVLDIQLPDMTGYAVLGRLRGDPALKTVPVVAVTAYAMVGDRAVGIAAGFDGYLAKPIDPQTFAQTIDQFLPVTLRGVLAAAESDGS